MRRHNYARTASGATLPFGHNMSATLAVHVKDGDVQDGAATVHAWAGHSVASRLAWRRFAHDHSHANVDGAPAPPEETADDNAALTELARPHLATLAMVVQCS